MGQVADGAEVVVEDNTPPTPDEPTPTTVQQMADDLRSMTGDEGDAAGTGDAAGGEAPPSSSPPASSGTPADEVETIDIGGFQIPVSETDSVVALLEWASSLTEEQAAAAFAAAAGPALAAPATPPPAPEPEPEAPTSAIPDEIRTAYPEVAAVMERMEQEIQSLRGEVEPRIEQVEMIAGHEAMTRQQREVAETEARVQQEFLHAHSLTEDDYLTVTRTVGQLGIVPTLVEQYGVEEGFKRALEIGYATTPEFRDRDVQAAIRAQATDAKKAKAGSLSPQGGSAPRQSQTPTNLPQTERKSAMIADIEQLLNGG